MASIIHVGDRTGRALERLRAGLTAETGRAVNLEETVDFLVEKEVGQQPPDRHQGKDLDFIDRQWEKLFSLQRDWGEPLSNDDV